VARFRKVSIAASLLGLVIPVVLGSCSVQTNDGESQLNSDSAPWSFDEYTIQLFDIVDLGDSSWEERQAQAGRIRDEYVAACMKTQGFVYDIASEDDTELTRGATIDPAVERGSRRFAEIYGYGRTPLVGTRVPPGLVAGVTDDPNADRLAAMTDDGRAAYNRSLYGSDAEGIDPESCWGQANSLPEVRSPAEDPLWQDLQSDYYGGFDGGTSTPQVRAAADPWRGCMAGMGYDIPSPKDLQVYLSSQIADDWYEATDSAIAKDHETEVSLATADWDCQEESGYRSALTAATAAYDVDFEQRRKMDLDSLLESYLEVSEQADSNALQSNGG
jgi:hypothetical protein